MAKASAAPRVVVIGGPNGAGKSTLAPKLLQGPLEIAEFVNADQIAAGLSAFNTESVAFEAGRIMLRRLRHLAAMKASFAFESTLASRTVQPFLIGLKAGGYEVGLLYVALPSPELAVARVKHRVRIGGHDVAEEVVRRRFHRSLKNLFELYLPVADDWQVLDNSRERRPVSVAAFDGTLNVTSRKKWLDLQRLAASAP